jgi:putative hemolysin
MQLVSSGFPDDIRAGSLQVRLARTPKEIEAALGLRFRIWVEEMGAHVSPAMHAARREWDAFDAFCDHLLVLEHRGGRPHVVGTYRLLRREAMRRCGQFYTAGEFDIGVIERYPGGVLELGRTCVDARYRRRAVIQLLWRGIGAYVAMHDIEVLFGCASFPGIHPEVHPQPLSYLYHYHLAPAELQLKALPERSVPMAMLPRDQVDTKAAFTALPALIKGYLRLGGWVGDGAVIDREYNTVDVGIVVKMAQVSARYVQRYGCECAQRGSPASLRPPG